jgi:hypothetical protein
MFKPLFHLFSTAKGMAASYDNVKPLDPGGSWNVGQYAY